MSVDFNSILGIELNYSKKQANSLKSGKTLSDFLLNNNLPLNLIYDKEKLNEILKSTGIEPINFDLDYLGDKKVFELVIDDFVSFAIKDKYKNNQLALLINILKESPDKFNLESSEAIATFSTDNAVIPLLDGQDDAEIEQLVRKYQKYINRARKQYEKKWILKSKI